MHFFFHLLFFTFHHTPVRTIWWVTSRLDVDAITLALPSVCETRCDRPTRGDKASESCKSGAPISFLLALLLPPVLFPFSLPCCCSFLHRSLRLFLERSCQMPSCILRIGLFSPGRLTSRPAIRLVRNANQEHWLAIHSPR